MIEYLKLTRYVWVGPAVMWVACCAMIVHAFGLVGLIHPAWIFAGGTSFSLTGLSAQEFGGTIGGEVGHHSSYPNALNCSDNVALPFVVSVLVTFVCYIAWWSQIVSV